MGDLMASWALFVAVATGAVFVVSGVAKLRSGAFVAQLANYRVLPRKAVLPVALGLPWVEIMLGAAVLVAPDPRLPLAGGAALLVLFSAGVGMNLVRGRQIPCGCRGGTRQIGWSLVVENILGAAAIVSALHWAVSPWAVFSSAESNLAAIDGLAAALTLALALGCARLKEALTTTHQHLQRAEQIAAAGGLSR